MHKKGGLHIGTLNWYLAPLEVYYNNAYIFYIRSMAKIINYTVVRSLSLHYFKYHYQSKN